MYVLGIDPSAKCVGWGLLASDGVEYDLAAWGTFSPDKLASGYPDEKHDRFRVMAWELEKLLDKYGLTSENTLAGVEHAAIGLVSARAMEVVLSAVMTAKTVFAMDRIPVMSVYPASWQALVRVKGYSTKECSELLVRDVYGKTGLPEDACDAIAIAHWAAIMSMERPFIGDVYRKLEEGISVERLYQVGRKEVDDLWNKRNDRTLDKKQQRALSKQFIEACATYRKNLEELRRDESLIPQSKVKIDGNAKPTSSLGASEALKRAKEIFDGD